ncbi:thioredoxin family protein [Sulfurospirillum sp.]|nr:thioredoxin family protein [Sulfurospirillum sp.]
MGGLMSRLISVSICILLFTCNTLWADFQSGKKLFEDKCSACHGGYIEGKIVQENFYEKNNEILKLKSPTVNMIAYSLKDSPLHVGEKDDPEMQKIEIEEFLKEYLYNPDISNSICDPVISKYYDKKESMKGKVSEDEISKITDYLFEYRKKRKKSNLGKVQLLSSLADETLLLNQAKKQNKVILIEAMSQTCHYCKTMEKDVFSDKNIQGKLDKDFIFVTVDIDKTKLPFGLDETYKGFTPSFFMINSSGKLVNEYPGGWTKEDFIEILNENR